MRRASDFCRHILLWSLFSTSWAQRHRVLDRICHTLRANGLGWLHLHGIIPGTRVNCQGLCLSQASLQDSLTSLSTPCLIPGWAQGRGKKGASERSKAAPSEKTQPPEKWESTGQQLPGGIPRRAGGTSSTQDCPWGF